MHRGERSVLNAAVYAWDFLALCGEPFVEGHAKELNLKFRRIASEKDIERLIPIARGIGECAPFFADIFKICAR